VLAGVTSSIVAAGFGSAATIASGAAQGAAQGSSQSGALDPVAYFSDMLFRAARPDAAAGPPQDVKAETARILAVSLKNGEVSPADRAYLAQVVGARTGLSQADAEKRVDDVVTQAKAAAAKVADAADQARRQPPDSRFSPSFRS